MTILTCVDYWSEPTGQTDGPTEEIFLFCIGLQPLTYFSCFSLGYIENQTIGKDNFE